MKVAVVYNRESKNVINLFGVPNREKYGQKAIVRIVAALKKGGHRVIALEGDKDLVPKLEEFMPRVVKGERPGMVFNLSYGIQGQAVLVEEYIEGREINVGLIGNRPPETLPPAELDFGDGPRIYTLEDKRHESGRDVGVMCPADPTTDQKVGDSSSSRRAIRMKNLRLAPRRPFSLALTRVADTNRVWE